MHLLAPPPKITTSRSCKPHFTIFNLWIHSISGVLKRYISGPKIQFERPKYFACYRICWIKKSIDVKPLQNISLWCLKNVCVCVCGWHLFPPPKRSACLCLLKRWQRENTEKRKCGEDEVKCAEKTRSPFIVPNAEWPKNVRKENWVCPCLWDTHTHTCMHARTHTHTRTRTHRFRNNLNLWIRCWRN